MSENIRIQQLIEARSNVIARTQTYKPLNKSTFLSFIPLQNSNYSSNPFVRAVQQGTTSTSNITVNSNSVGNSIEIDLRIDDVSAGFWGWSIPSISWNPAVLKLTNVQEGPFLSDQSGASAYFIGNSPVLWNNTSGKIDGGLSEALTSGSISRDSSGVLATLTFQIKNVGTSEVMLSGVFTIASISQANISIYPPSSLSYHSATVNVLSRNSSSVAEFPLWINGLVFMLPLIFVLVLASCKKNNKKFGFSSN
ncbi:MAG: cohesin domain-containing protein [Candidatus Bathyarchaeia archaeon]